MSVTMRVTHKKRGTVYDTVGEGTIQCDRPIADYDEVMIYRDPYSGKLWVRPLLEFTDGRFAETPAPADEGHTVTLTGTALPYHAWARSPAPSQEVPAQGPLVPWELRCLKPPQDCTAPECDCPLADQPQGRLRQAIIDNTQGDAWWIGEILLAVLEKETGFGELKKPGTASAPIPEYWIKCPSCGFVGRDMLSVARPERCTPEITGE